MVGEGWKVQCDVQTGPDLKREVGTRDWVTAGLQVPWYLGGYLEDPTRIDQCAC